MEDTFLSAVTRFLLQQYYIPVEASLLCDSILLYTQKIYYPESHRLKF